MRLVSLKEVAGVDLGPDIVQGAVVAVGDDGVGAALELGDVVDHLAAEEGRAVLQRRLVDNDLGALGLDPLHDALDGALAEIVAVGLHRETVDPDHAFLLAGAVVLAVLGIIAGPLEHLVGDEVLPGAVGLHNGLDKVLRHVGVVRQQLFGVLREAIAAVAEGRIVVVRADARIQTHAVDNGPRVESLHLRIGVQLVEIADAEGKVGVGE